MRVVVARHFDRVNHSTMREAETDRGREGKQTTVQKKRTIISFLQWIRMIDALMPMLFCVFV